MDGGPIAVVEGISSNEHVLKSRYGGYAEIERLVEGVCAVEHGLRNAE